MGLGQLAAHLGKLNMLVLGAKLQAFDLAPAPASPLGHECQIPGHLTR